MPELALPTTECYPVPARVRSGALVTSRQEHERLYRRSIEDRDGFWREQAEQHMEWIQPFHTVCEEDFATGRIGWYLGGKLNVSVNCLDRHLAARGDKYALVAEGDEPGDVRHLTYRELYEETCRPANRLL